MWDLTQKGVLLLSLVMVTGCAGLKLPAIYVDTAQFLDNRPIRKDVARFQVAVKPFENQLSDHSKVGIKRVGVNEISGPVLPSQDVIPVIQQSVLTQLALKGIRVGASPLRLEGSVRDFFVDVDVDPASGRGKFTAMARVELSVWDAEFERRVWQETYTGKAFASAPSVVDSVYERTLKLAFTNLLVQIRQDATILELQPAYEFLMDVQPPPSRPPEDASPSRSSRSWQPEPLPYTAPTFGQHPAPELAVRVASTHMSPVVTLASATALTPWLADLAPPMVKVSRSDTDAVPPRITFLSPELPETATQTETTSLSMRITGLAADASGVVDMQIKGARARMQAAPEAILRQAGLAGSGMQFIAFALLTPGSNQVEIQASDGAGNQAHRSLVIQRQTTVDTDPPRLAMLEPQNTRGLSVVSDTKSQQLVVGLAADPSGIAEIRINGVTARMTVASLTELREAGLTGTGVKFFGYAELQSHMNQAEIVAIDRRQNVGRQTLTIQQQQIVREQLRIKDLYDRSLAVVIGIDHYDTWPSLGYAVRNAKEMTRTLKALGFDEVIELLDREATRAGILHLLGTELRTKVGWNDRVVVFFAGHVRTVDLPNGRQKAYLIPVDVSTGISTEELAGLARQLSVKHVFYAVDGCASGLSLQRALSTRKAAGQDTLSFADDLVAQPAVQLVTACERGQRIVTEEDQSLFTRYFMQGLKGEADVDDDGLITATELGTYLVHQVSIASDNRQTPQHGQMDGQGEVVFMYN